MNETLGAQTLSRRPVRAVQFGTGAFLRGFADWMLDIVNEKTDWNGGVVLVKSTDVGSLDALRGQNLRYTVLLRGLADGAPVVERREITTVQGAVDSRTQYEAYAALARIPSVRFLLSNTTEAGIVYDEGDAFDLCPPRSFPGKLCKFLYERARCFDFAADKGVIVLPTELIPDNGATLREYVLRHAEHWDLGERFAAWVQEHCRFVDTLVDRIVTGYPPDAEALFADWGYRDACAVAAEPYALWAMACGGEVERELPLQRAGLPVLYARDLAPYRMRKVRILNGAHTAFVPAAFLAGHLIVRDAVLDPDFAAMIERTLQEEVLPTIPLPKEALAAYAREVLTRFANPFIDHALLSICLNSVSKWRARILPTLLDCLEREGRPPRRLCFSLAALLRLYSGEAEGGQMRCLRGKEPYLLRDEPRALRFLAAHAGHVRGILSCEALWGMDLCSLPGVADEVETWYNRIGARGVRACVKDLGA
jgi:tagaturonate reductase